MAHVVEAIPHLLLRVFAPALGITLVAWLVVLFVQLFLGKRQSCRFPPAENGSGESAASPRGGLGKPVWVGLAAHDRAAYVEKIPWLTPDGTETTNAAYAWTAGTVYINNPFGWNAKGTTNGPPHKSFGEDIRATFMLDENGRVGVFKLSNWVERKTNDVIRLYGPRTEEMR